MVQGGLDGGPTLADDGALIVSGKGERPLTARKLHKLAQIVPKGL